jgi:hypothetical protein
VASLKPLTRVGEMIGRHLAKEHGRYRAARASAREASCKCEQSASRDRRASDVAGICHNEKEGRRDHGARQLGCDGLQPQIPTRAQ